MSDAIERDLADSDATEAFGAELATICRDGGVVWLEGDLGAGKTTLCRGLLHAFGHAGAVKSPTYTLVEPYELSGLQVYHFDLYRLHDPEELEFMGVRDYFNAASLCLVEWPQRGVGHLPKPDLVVEIQVVGNGRRVCVGAHSARGRALLAALN
jgi:tRNA threonylcarbamoyladenosine biosynthesis protein TsaE